MSSVIKRVLLFRSFSEFCFSAGDSFRRITMDQIEIEIRSAEAASHIQFAVNLLNPRLNQFILVMITRLQLIMHLKPLNYGEIRYPQNAQGYMSPGGLEATPFPHKIFL